MRLRQSPGSRITGVGQQEEVVGKHPNDKADPLGRRRPPFPIRWLVNALLFGQDALDYDRRAEAVSVLTDRDVADQLRKSGSPLCHSEYVAQLRSMITAFAELREAQGPGP